MQLTFVRNATLVIDYADHCFLIDPALDPVGARPPVPNTVRQERNPLVPVPESVWQAIDRAQTVVLTHLHSDHFDATARERLSKALPVLAQPQQVDEIRAMGFTDVTGVESSVAVSGITITRTDGQHGTGEIGRAMAPVSGFVFRHPAEPTLYIAGDTIWCDEVAQAIAHHEPDVIVVNAGGARFLTGDPITMTAADVASTALAAARARVVAVHLEAIAHCPETRTDLAAHLATEELSDRVHIPADGETLAFPRT